MMTNEKIVTLIDASKGMSSCLQICHDLLSSGSAMFLSEQPGQMSAAEALATFSIRTKKAAAAGVSIPGADSLLDVLGQQPRGESVLLFHIATHDRVFSVFVAESSATILGCVCLQRRADGTTVSE